MATEFSAELVFLTALVILPLIPAVVLFKALPSKGQISGPFHGLNLKFSGAFTAYLILFILLLQIRPRDFDHYHTWQVTGDVEFQRAPHDGRPDPTDIKVRLTPPDYVVNPNGPGGKFSFDVPVPSKRGSPAFPRLYVDLPGYEPLTLSLAADDQDGDGNDIKVQRNDKTREIRLGKITLRSLALVEVPYDAAKAQIAAEERPGGQP